MKLPIHSLFPAFATAALLIAAPALSTASVITPGDIAGLTLFLDSRNGLSYDESNKVHQWDDQATDGPYNATQSNGALKPTFSPTGGGGGSPTVNFGGIGGSDTSQGGYLTVSGAQDSVSTSLTMFVVFSIDSLDTSMALVDASNTNSTNIARNGFSLYNHSSNGMTITFKDPAYTSSGNLTLFSTSLGAEHTPLDTFVVAVAQIQSDGTTMIRVGDHSVTVDRSLTLTDISGYDSSLRIGANLANTWRFGGSVSSVALYDRALTEQEIEDVYGFMHNNYVAVPEPQTMALMGAAAAGLLIWRKRRS